MHSHAYSTRNLKLLARAEDFQLPGDKPLGVGDRVQLNSGGPLGLVVDIGESTDELIVAWNHQVNGEEGNLPRLCVHRFMG
jgi:hypothetical protein